MIRQQTKILLAISSLMFASLACLLQAGEVLNPPIPPTVDQAQLDAIVAETVSAALQLTASAPTPTQPATPTSPPTLEPTASATPLPQSSITQQADGTSLFV